MECWVFNSVQTINALSLLSRKKFRSIQYIICNFRGPRTLNIGGKRSSYSRTSTNSLHFLCENKGKLPRGTARSQSRRFASCLGTLIHTQKQTTTHKQEQKYTYTLSRSLLFSSSLTHSIPPILSLTFRPPLPPTPS